MIRRLRHSLGCWLLLAPLCLGSMNMGNFAAPGPDRRVGPHPAFSLRGVILSVEPASCLAVVLDRQTGRIEAVRIGEAVGGFRVAAIHSDCVVLIQGTRIRRIFLLKPSDIPPPNSRAQDSTSSSLSSCSPETTCDPDLNIVRKSWDRSKILRRIATEWATLLRGTGFRSHNIGGGHPGLKLTRIPDRGLLHDIGLRKNDVILEVNGRKLVSVDDLLGLYLRLRSSTRIDILIERGRTRVLFSHDLQRRP